MEFKKIMEERYDGMMEAYEYIQETKELEYMEEGLSKIFMGWVDDEAAIKEIGKLRMGKKGFINFLKKKYPEFQESEITGAKTKEEMDAVREKYINDFKDWATKRGHLKAMGYKYLMTAASMFAFPAIHLYFTLCFWSSAISWWKTGRKLKKGETVAKVPKDDENRSFK